MSRWPALATVLLLHAGALALMLVTRAPVPVAPAPAALRLFEVAAVAKPAPVRAAVMTPPGMKLAVSKLAGPPVAAPLPAATAGQPAVAVAVAAVAPPPAASAGATDDDGTARSSAYAQLLWRHIAAHRPPGMPAHGTAVVAFSLDRSGGVHDAVIAQSSGNAMLDRMALRSVRLAAPMPAPPRDFADDALRFSLPFSFG